ncbi:unnamed protein product [Arctogadus glacialis]
MGLLIGESSGRRSGYRRPWLRWLGWVILGLLFAGFARQCTSLYLNNSSLQPVGPLKGPLSGLPRVTETCRPHTHLMFLKTHKTASSTVLNILYRFGEEHGLRFALPMGYMLGYPFAFNVHRIKGYRGNRAAKYDIMANHLRFNKDEVQKVLHKDTFYFSILREPLSLAKSSFAYFHDICPTFRKAGSLGAFADSPGSFHKAHLRNSHYARNLLWFDFGMDPNANVTQEQVREGLVTIRKNFKLILLSEYFDQSMVLLRHALCWPLDAVVSFTLNKAHYRPPQGGAEDGFDLRQPVVNVSLTPAQREKLREWNALDWHLYQAFNRSFWEDVRHFGPERMDQEVALLRARRDQLAGVCLPKAGEPVEAHHIGNKDIRPYQCGSVRILGYELQQGLDNATTEACLRLIRPEIQYKDLLDAKQFPRSQPYIGDPAGKLDVNGLSQSVLKLPFTADGNPESPVSKYTQGQKDA